MFAPAYPYQSFLVNGNQDLEEGNLEFEALLHYLKANRGCNLTGYKRSTLMRRFKHRMQRISIHSYQGYLQYLECHPEEHLALLNTVLINFTSFFRDQDAWSTLTTDVIPCLVANRQSGRPMRFWSAGCAAGQEIYSLLILLSEILGLDYCLHHVQCYATDADAEALQHAERASYNELEILGMPPELLEKYFQRTEGGYIFHPALRCLVTFQQHDLMEDAPLVDIDLLVCRNVLMYFLPEAQKAILTSFRSVLKHPGFLFVGQAELLLQHNHLFKPVNLKQRIYTTGLTPTLNDGFSISPTRLSRLTAL